MHRSYRIDIQEVEIRQIDLRYAHTRIQVPQTLACLTIEGRYSRKTTIITTNLDYQDWYELFQRKPLVDAMLDRLKHHCITIKTSGPSLRTP